MAEELFQDFSLEGEDSILNSLAPTAGTETITTDPPTDPLQAELQDFSLDDLPIQTTAATTDTEKRAETTTVQSKQKKEDTPGQFDTTSLYAPLASALHDQGILPNFDTEEFENSEDKQEALFKAIQKEISGGINEFVSSLPEKFKEQLVAYQQGVDLEDYQKVQSQRLNLEKVTEDTLADNIDLQKQVLKSNLLAKGYSEEKASKYIDNWESLNELESEAKDALVEEKARLKKQEQAKIVEAEERRRAAEEATQQTIQKLNTTLESTEEIIPGKKLNKIQREKILNSMTAVVTKDTHGNPLNAVMASRAKNPIDFEIKLHYLHSLGVFDGDWSSIVKTAKTNAINDLDRKLQEAMSFTGSQAGPGGNKKEGDSILNLL